MDSLIGREVFIAIEDIPYGAIVLGVYESYADALKAISKDNLIPSYMSIVSRTISSPQNK